MVRRRSRARLVASVLFWAVVGCSDERGPTRPFEPYQGEPYPSLASGWEISEDGLTYEFAIRDGLEFSDGTPLVAEDVRRSWLRLLDPATAATAPDVLSIVVGASDRVAGRADEDEVGIRAPDDHTLVVELVFRHPLEDPGQQHLELEPGEV